MNDQKRMTCPKCGQPMTRMVVNNPMEEGWRVDDEWATTYCHGYRRIQEENEKSTYCEHTVTHWMPLPPPPKED